MINKIASGINSKFNIKHLEFNSLVPMLCVDNPDVLLRRYSDGQGFPD